MAEKPAVHPSYFVRVPLVWAIVCPYLLGLVALGILAPNVIPEWLPIAKFVLHMGDHHFFSFLLPAGVCTLIAHAYEAKVARSICYKLGLDNSTRRRWILQTAIYGFPSLYQLLRPKVDNIGSSPKKAV